MPIDFPNSPVEGQVYTYQGKSWIWNGTGWDSPRALSEIGAVQTFADAAARTAAIPSPTEGIVSYLNDVDALQVYNGTAWRSPFGETLLASVNLSGTSYFINNIFTSEFTNYRITYRMNVTSNSRPVFTLSASGSLLNSAVYRNNWEEGASTRTIYGNTNGTDFVVMDAGLTDNSTYTGNLTLFSPQLAEKTHAINIGMAAKNLVGITDRPWAYNAYGVFDSTTQADGINFLAFSGTISGTARVYGMRN